MKINQKKAGAILSYLSEFIKILTALVYTPIMLRLLGQSEYGLYQLVFSVVSNLSLLSLGFGSSYVRFYSRFKVRNDVKGEEKLNGLFMSVFLVFMIVCTICGAILVYNIEGVFDSGLTKNEYIIARKLMIIMVISMSLTFPSSVFNCIITAHEKFIVQKGLILAQSILSPFLSLPVLLLGYGSVGMVAVTLFITVLSFLVNGYYVIKKIGARFCYKNLDFSLLKEMSLFTFFIFLNQIIDQINWSIDKFLLGRLSGTIAVAVYGVGGQINSLYLQFSSSVSSVFAPQVNRLVSEGDNDEKLSEIFIKVGRIQYFILVLIYSGFVFFGKQFISLWAGDKYEEAYYVGLLLLGPVTVPLIQNLGIEIQRAKNKHQVRSIVYFAIAIANVFISIPLIKLFGPVGAALGTAITLFIGNVVFMNWYYYYAIKIDIAGFWGNIIKASRGMFVPIALGVILNKVVKINNWVSLAFVVLAYSMIYALSLWLLSLNEYEKQLILGKIKR